MTQPIQHMCHSLAKPIFAISVLITVTGSATAQDKPSVVALSVTAREAIEPAAIIKPARAKRPKKKEKQKRNPNPPDRNPPNTFNPHDRYPTN